MKKIYLKFKKELKKERQRFSLTNNNQKQNKILTEKI